MKRLGVIGYGSRIRHMQDVIDTYNADVHVVAAVDPAEVSLRVSFPERLESVAFYDDVDAMLDGADLDGVMIGTRCRMHTPYAIKVLERGLPLYLEKPVSISEEQVQELHDASQRTASPVVVSFPLRLSHLCQMAKEIVDSGVLGTVENVQAINNVPFYSSTYYHRWMRDEYETGGLWLQKATHDFDYLNYLIGRPPERIIAVESKTVFTGTMPAGLHCVECPKRGECPESPQNLFYKQGLLADMSGSGGAWDSLNPNSWQCSFAVDTGNHDAATAILQYESGAHATYTQNFYARRGAARRGATLIGYTGTLTFDWYDDEITVHHHHTGRVERHRLERTTGGHHGGDHELAHDFLAVLHGTGPSRATLADGLLSAQMCLMARESCQASQFQAYTPLATQAEPAFADD